MKFVVDTNVLVRLVDSTSIQHKQAEIALSKLLHRKELLFVFLQQISEFWNVCSRPVANNGLGMTLDATNRELLKLESVFDVLPDTTEVYHNWLQLVLKHSVSGIKVHDAKIVAAMMAHGIDSLLTFNISDFKRYDEITAVSPADL